MNFLHKVLLLQWMQQQCRNDSRRDWLSLHRREHDWLHAHPRSRSRWRLLEEWLHSFGPPIHLPLQHLPLLLGLAGFATGASLMAGLLEIQPLARINLWWWLLFAVVLPFFTWLLGLWFGHRSPERRAVWALLLARLPPEWRPQLNRPLLILALNTLVQHFSLWFAFGLLACFGTYLILTDLSFGWASTLDISINRVHHLLEWIAAPWHSLWPDAVPDAELVLRSRFWHDQPLAAPAGLPGQWWRFLLMCLLFYVLLPRLASYLWLRLRLNRALKLLFQQDPCLAGWWQRLHLQLAERDSGPHQPPSGQASATPLHSMHRLPPIQQVLHWDTWQETWLAHARKQLPSQLAQQHWLAAQEWRPQPKTAQQVLLLCQAWEPPTGALNDFCQSLRGSGTTLYLWPMPLPGMPAQRTEQLRRSWELFMPQLPGYCHLLELPCDDD